MAPLPTLLAGPILRRCNPSEITIWLAMSKPMPQLGVKLWEVLSTTERRIALSAPDIFHVPVSAAFHVYLVRVRPASGLFPAERILLYDVGIKPAPPPPDSERIYTEKQLALAFGEFDLPSLILQKPGSPRLRVLYGSCRKYHGPDFDATLAADYVMQRHAADPSTRPHALLLGGDQIYGDDVPALLIRTIQDLARALLGFDEPLPGIQKPNTIAVDGRQAAVETAKLTSGHAANHLLTFGEYCAAYLLAWNPDVWPTFVDVLVLMGEERPPIGEALEELQLLDQYWKGCILLRSLLANVPTYMTFDDHEITDDWFLNPQVKARTLATDLGKRVVANGMAAYWLFQAIGNDFDYFRGEKIDIRRRVVNHVNALSASGSATTGASKVFDETFTKLQSWDFVVPTSPPVLFLDTRTRRLAAANRLHMAYIPPGAATLSNPRPLKEPAHVSAEAPRLFNTATKRLAYLLKQIRRQRDRRIILLTPSPVYGLTLIEKAVASAVDLPLVKAASVDFESFQADPNSFLDVVSLLLMMSGRGSSADALIGARSQLDMAVILSGDVHYGFSVGVSIHFPQFPDKPLRVAQFTSSATKNAPEGALKAGLKVVSSKLALPSYYGLRFWWREGSDGAAHSSITVPFPTLVKQISRGRQPNWLFSLRDPQNRPSAASFQKLSGGAELRFCEAVRFELAGKKSFVEIGNNMGYLEISNFRVKNRLIKWDGSYVESLATDWDANNWPVSIKP